MATAGDLVVNLGLNSQKLVRGLGGASSKISSFVSSAVSSFSKFGLMMNRVQAAVNLLSKLAGPVQLAAQAEQTAISFKVMLGSAEAAKKVMGDLTKFSDITPFEPDETLAAGRAFLGVGTAAEDLIPTLTMVGNMAVASQAPFGELAASISKMRSENRVMAEELNQLTGRGIPVVKLLADQFGVTQGEVRELASAGKIKFAALEQALMKLYGAGGKFGKLMAEQAESAGGLWSTLQGAFTNIQKEFGEQLTEGLGLKEFLKESIAFAEDFVKALTSAGPKLKESFSAVAKAIGDIGKALTGTTDRMEAMQKTLDATAWVINEMAGSLERAAKVLKLHQDWTNAGKDFLARMIVGDPFAGIDISQDPTRFRGLMVMGDDDEAGAPTGRRVALASDSQEEASREHDAWLRKKAAEIAKTATTPLEKFETAWRDLRIVLDADKISQEQYNAALAKLREELRKSDPIWKATQELIKQTRTPLEEFNAEMARLDELARKGVPRELLDRGLAGARKKFQESDPLAKAQKAMREDAKKYAKAARTPTQVFQDEIAKLKALRDLGPGRGGISQEVFRKNALAAEKDAAEAIDAEQDRPKGSPAAIEAGSAAAFSAIVGAMKQKEELKELREIKEYLRQQAQKTPPATVISFGDA